MCKSVVFVAALAAAFCVSAQECAYRLFASSYFNTVQVFDACTGAYLRDLDSSARIRGAQAVKLGPNGLLYVTSEQSQQILRYRNDTLEFVDVFTTFAAFDPTGFAIAPNGDFYVGGFRTSQVRRVAATGAPIDVPVAARAAGLDGPD